MEQPISMAQAHFYGAGLLCGAGILLWSKPISMEQAYFYGAGLLLWSRPMSMEQARFYGAGLLLGSRRTSMKQVYMQELYFCEVGLFMWSRPSLKRVYLLLRMCVKGFQRAISCQFRFSKKLCRKSLICTECISSISKIYIPIKFSASILTLDKFNKWIKESVDRW